MFLHLFSFASSASSYLFRRFHEHRLITSWRLRETRVLQGSFVRGAFSIYRIPVRAQYRESNNLEFNLQFHYISCAVDVYKSASYNRSSEPFRESCDYRVRPEGTSPRIVSLGE